MGVIGRRRRPRWIWFLIMITVIVLLVDLVVTTRSDEPSRRVAALGYLDEVRAQIEQSNRLGADVTDVRSKAAQLGRAGVTRRLDRVARDAQRTLDTARSAEAPDELSDARSLLLTTLWLRARGTRFMKDALESALGKTSPQAAMAKMADVGADLTAADRTYQGFVNAVNEHKEFGRAAALPASRWIEDETAWAPEVLGAFITALRSAAELAPIHDVRIVLVTTEPGAVRKDGERLVLPLSKTIRTHIVVANVGNEPERNLKVEVALTPGGERATARDFVSLSPGQRQTVTLGGLVPLVDQNAELTVTIDRPAGDTNDDNVRVIPLVAKQ